MKNFELSFEDYAQDILPRRMEMLNSLLKHPFPVKSLFGKGQGEKNVIKKIGRVSDFKGLYAFIQNDEVIYVGTSEKVVNRLSYQVKGYTKYQAHLAWEIAKEYDLYTNKKQGTPNLKKAKNIIMNMHVIFLEITSPLERHLMEVYSCMKFDCKFNIFEGHR
ncbi:hypothetical protein [Fulvivirga sediminis]|uniref:GIY-YIG domain-containing protein n=1 Tax=Fulvivirga sediminis TaxID=2803949 RepID=A0A937K0E6_9BACT|nr:hypothetical protein [Fulvivirga sediminis]MBL3657579.1 hypothetical protein [Fulvivirga sediminis]